MEKTPHFPIEPLSSRRAFLAGLGAVAAAPAAATLQPAGPGSRPGALDVHHHFLPPFYKAHATPWLRRFASNVEEALAWTPEGSLAAMDKAGVQTSVLSISAPAVDLGGGASDVDLARRCNDYAAGLVRAYPGRFRFFAVLPMPSVAAAIAEARRALDTLGAEGVGLLSNYGGRYLGDSAFAPLFQELSRRGALTYVHPTTAPCCAGLVPDLVDPLIELPVDTGRTVASLLWSGTLSRHPRIKWLLSHGGGILPMVAERVSAMQFVRPELRARVPEGPAAALARLHVDTASVANAPAIAALRAWLPPRQILFGTDYPWGAPDRTLAALDRLGLPADVLSAIRRDNALLLMN